MARNKRRSSTPNTNQSNQSSVTKTGIIGQPSNVSGNSTQNYIDTIQNLKKEIENLNKKINEYNEKELELQEKEKRAINGFKDLEAEVRSSWLQEKEMGLEQESLSLQTEREKILDKDHADADLTKAKAHQEAD